MNDERSNCSCPADKGKIIVNSEPNDHFESGGNGREARVSITIQAPQIKTEPAGQ